jgi:hypothetical protein
MSRRVGLYGWPTRAATRGGMLLAVVDAFQEVIEEVLLRR